jgi:hypothetical protein
MVRLGEIVRKLFLHSDILLPRRKGTPLKVKLALKLRAETTVTLGWFAERLQMGTRGHLANLLCQAKTG